jgi:predicted dienelactone hydrolase
MRPLLITVAALALVASACASDDGPASSSAPATASSATEPAATQPPDTEPPATETPTTEPPDTEPPATETPTTEPPDTEPARASVESVGLGPYEVGVQTITITDVERDRPLTVDVWFPLADDSTATEGARHRYSLVEGTYYESPTAFSATPDAIAPGGPFPLVVYSHGSGGIRYLASYYTEAIASHGYIVAAPDHTGNTALERITDTADDGAVIAINRPNDIAAVIDQMTNPESLETVGFVASVDPENVAVTGHSFGGFTAYAMNSGYSNGVGEVTVDPRVDAIIPLAPATGSGGNTLLSDERLTALNAPTLVIGGTNDQTTPIDPNVTRPWDLAMSDPHYRLDLIDAQHQSFTDICDYQEFLPTLENPLPVVVDVIDAFAVEGCSPGDMPIDRAKDLTNTYAITFLESIFRGGTMFTPETYETPVDVVYFAT